MRWKKQHKIILRTQGPQAAPRVGLIKTTTVHCFRNIFNAESDRLNVHITQFWRHTIPAVSSMCFLKRGIRPNVVGWLESVNWPS